MQETRALEQSNMYARVDIRHVQSVNVDQEFRLCVAKPAMPVPPGTKLPVIYGLDGSWLSGLTIDSALYMVSARELPPAIVVTIGYPLELGLAAIPLRSRDLTPTRRAPMEKFLFARADQRGTQVQTGGAANFLKFIAEELKPLIERDYGGDPNDATITGSSFGGLFGAYALFNAPSVFKRYNLASPSLWWDEQLLVKQEAAFAAANRELDAKVFICAGGLERKDKQAEAMKNMPPAMLVEYQKLDPSDRDTLMVEIVEPFAERLASRDYKKLEVSHHLFEGESHNSLYMPALSRGLRTVFGTYKT